MAKKPIETKDLAVLPEKDLRTISELMDDTFAVGIAAMNERFQRINTPLNLIIQGVKEIAQIKIQVEAIRLMRLRLGSEAEVLLGDVPKGAEALLEAARHELRARKEGPAEAAGGGEGVEAEPPAKAGAGGAAATPGVSGSALSQDPDDWPPDLH